MADKYIPAWQPKNAGDEFACRVMTGVEERHDGMTKSNTMEVTAANFIKRKVLEVNDYVQGVLAGDRMILSRAITLIESNAPKHRKMAQEILQVLLPYTGKSIRIGITGVPGAGKSTFIEALGMNLCQRSHKVAVLAVDPSSSITKGSILGDKTRMEKLTKEQNAFIRPSPSGGTLGGVTKKSRETLLLCEAAGYDVILVETVGVGQSEITVRSMVDFFLLIVLTGAGDELQGMKKGVMEIADAILINKADGDNKAKAEMVRVEYERIIHYLRQATAGWQTHAYTCSSLTGEGINELWQIIQEYKENVTTSGIFAERRKMQTLAWVYAMVEEYLKNNFYQHEQVKLTKDEVDLAVSQGEISATRAMEKLIRVYEDNQA